MTAPTPTTAAAEAPAPAALPPALGPGLGALARRLENTAQVLAALAAEAGEPDDETSRRLAEAAARMTEVVELLGGGEEGEAARPAGPVFRGRNDLTSLVDFVSLLSHMGRNGVLEVRAEEKSFTLQLDQGSVLFAAGGAPAGLRLGDVLVEQGALTEATLEQALAERRAGEVLGDLLLRTERVTPAELEAALTQQMAQLFGRMHGVGTGFEFVFEEGRHVLADSHARQGASMLLLEGARLLDEGGLWKAEDDDADLGTTWLAEFAEDEDPGLDVETIRSFIEVLVLEERLDLTCAPSSAGRLLNACWQDDGAGAVAVVERDPLLCAQVLHAAAGHDVSSVRAAVEHLGPEGMRNLALTLALNDRPWNWGGWKELLDGLRRTAAIAAEFGALLGERRLQDPERGRLLALMADIGKPVVLGAILDIERECGSRLAPSAASGLLEEFHVRVGAWLARHWDFPKALVRVVEHHHSHRPLTGRALLEVRLVEISQELARFVQGPDRGDLERLQRLPAFAATGLRGAELKGLLRRADAILAAVDGR